MKNKLIESIKLYKSFIEKNKIPEHLFGTYRGYIKQRERILSLIKSNRFSSNKFDKLPSHLKWDLVDLLKSVEWKCITCDSKQDKPHRVFMGELMCANCDSLLTRRTNGGQSDDFNWTFTRKKK